ncbi:uncharacterized protein B0J16DRAFT_387884 [Fusarium flagelliforme]|uniref:Serine threonine protein kinase n=1 Tax=Fusarium flagelliforme TaxID=2675880 RepID=A0A395MGP3_9HYPO|nr:uncharacterized protein B0J16DRAFT_387884 [Fusarium flagelliforme]KAH7180056.1 hypothetical protein B0J16DRAFT_387884 [Fusarium flagelliforme]RFN47067.1 serine threonine protein kinase [Fusarium flagelliforme]
MRSAVAIVLALANFSLVSAAPASKVLGESAFDNAETPTWKIAVVDGEDPVEFKGTVQDVMKQLKVDYPEYARKAQEEIEASIKAEDESGANEPPSPEAQALDRLQRRDSNICWNFPAAREKPIRIGINYLRGIRGPLTVRAGPGACDRVSCSDDAAIFICNDNRTPFRIPTWDHVANAAAACNNECREFCFGCGIDTAWYTAGQRFHDANFNVIVRKHGC